MLEGEEEEEEDLIPQMTRVPEEEVEEEVEEEEHLDLQHPDLPMDSRQRLPRPPTMFRMKILTVREPLPWIFHQVSSLKNNWRFGRQSAGPLVVNLWWAMTYVP